jgi:hypothetical protein
MAAAMVPDGPAPITNTSVFSWYRKFPTKLEKFTCYRENKSGEHCSLTIPFNIAKFDAPETPVV